MIEPQWVLRRPAAVEVDGTARLLDVATRAGIGHFRYVSIVGIERQGIPRARKSWSRKPSYAGQR